MVSPTLDQETLTDKQMQGKPHIHYWAHHFQRYMEKFEGKLKDLEEQIKELKNDKV